ncbi:MAG: hypothetical protein WCQ53_03665 [bacterium]
MEKIEAKKMGFNSAPALEDFMESFMTNYKGKDAVETQKMVLRYFLGWEKPTLFTRSMRVKGFAGGEIALIKKYDACTRIASLREAVLDFKFFKPKKEDTIKLTCVDVKDWEYLCGLVNILELDISKCIYNVDDVDEDVARVRISNSNRITVNASPLSTLAEDYIQKSAYITQAQKIRVLIAKYALGEMDELTFCSEIAKLYTSVNIALRQVMLYLEKHYRQIQSVSDGEKTDNKDIKADVEYLNLILNQKD